MKISNSKKELARIISENGGWREGAESAAQSKSDNAVSFYRDAPDRGGDCWWGEHLDDCDIGQDRLIANWHRSCISRAEYFHLYPAPDAPKFMASNLHGETASIEGVEIGEHGKFKLMSQEWCVKHGSQDADGWIEWKGGECPVGDEELVRVKVRGESGAARGKAGHWSWGHSGCGSDIIAYRPHKPEQAELEYKDGVKPTDPAKVEGPSKPTIEQLADDYHNANYCAERKQKEADSAKADAEDKLKALELAGEALGLLVSPISAKQEPELVITNRSQLKLGDVIWLSDSPVKGDNELTPSGEYTVVKVGVIGVESGGQTIYPDFSAREWRFIRRP